MGNRATVQFTARNKFMGGGELIVSPVVYLHWDGDMALEWIKEAAPRLRASDPHYAAARFCAYCAEQIPGELSLGIYDSDNAPSGESGQDYLVDLTEGTVSWSDGRDSISIDNFYQG